MPAAAAAAGRAAGAKIKRKPLTDYQRNLRSATRAQQKMSRNRVAAAGEMQQQRIDAATAIRSNTSRIRDEEIARRNRKRAITGAATSPFQSHKTVGGPSSIINPIMLVIFTWAGIVIMYALITSPNTSSGFFNSMREWVGLLYQTKPMFTTKETIGA